MPAELNHVLCVDDEDDIVEIMKLCLAMLPGVEVTSCDNGAEAIELARRTRPDIILLDVMMPRIDGPTALGRIRADPDLADIPVALVTARVQPAEVQRYLDQGATAVIAKPFDPMTLADEVKAIWEGSRPRMLAAS